MIARDRGVVFQLDGADIETSYVSPSSVTYDQYTGRVPRRRFSVACALDASTDITSITVKVEASYDDGVTWQDAASFDAATGDPADVEHVFSDIVDDVISGSIYVDAGLPLARIAVKANAAGQGDDSLTVSASDEVVGPTVTGAMIEAEAVSAEKLADDAVQTPAIEDGAVTTAKLASEAVTAAKLDDAALKLRGFSGRSGAGACTLTGAKVGDVVCGLVNITDGGDTTSSFESTVTVADQIQQSSASDLSSKKFSVLLLRRG